MQKRVLPGFDEDAKIKVLKSIKDKLEIIICVYAGDLERNKTRQDLGITYDIEVLRMIDDLRAFKLEVNSVVITRYENQVSANVFSNKLERRGIKVYKHYPTKGYPTDVDTIVSDEGFGKNPYIETKKPIVIVTAPGANSGKLGTCLSQLYHESRRGKIAGYSKYETFPVWNLPLKHPVNIAYEAATVDLKDVNMIDFYHLEAYGVTSVNYNRDIELFPVLNKIIEKITGRESAFKSPTDMGVNKVADGIIDDEVVKKASIEEIIRRYYNTLCDYKKGIIENDVVSRMKMIMEELGLKGEDRKVALMANLAKEKESFIGEDGEKKYPNLVSIELNSGKFVNGKFSKLMNGSAAVILNAIKELAEIQDDIHLISPLVLEPIISLKKDVLKSRTIALDAEEVLMALSISAVTNPVAQYAMSKLKELKGCQAHSTVILSNDDEQVFRKLGIDVTSDPLFLTSNLFES